MKDDNWSGAERARRIAALGVLLIAASMLGATLAGLDVRTRNLAPMSPVTCVGFIAAAIGAGALPRRHRLAVGAGLLTALTGAAGMLDSALDSGRWINRAVFDTDAAISVFTATALVLIGAAITLHGRGWVVTRRLAFAAGAIGAAAVIGFLLGVPYFYGGSRFIQMSWQAALCTVLISLAIIWSHPSGQFFSDTLSGRFARRTVPAVLGIPIVSGALATAVARAGWWEWSVAAWVMTLTAVGGLAFVVAMAVKRLEEDDRRLTELAIRDPLTGAYNRRHFLTQAENAAARARRYGESAAIAVIDLDRFKAVNDQWGHAAGDEALTRIHRALRARLRSSDVLGRIGGDEFAALILHVNPDEASHVAAELRAAVHEVGREMTAEGRPNQLGASIGVATMTTDAEVEALVELADQRMYDEKRLAHEVESRANH
ncbi:diguanylate cyclase (GGDEF)-like protein [Solirubrobacter pauli]|uniref:Diguanylate cyclase (GGDEF)-like protein n=1 Tax=Solirubrobacter pauli TaxID=166793 RepID=A0A660LEU2_9ACTN|nr:GGDEF domain-containing protein [Solirubrobacter pauli]RKQ93602.1 diguanylate cyclase (GGDEF)-like protein [Solirubrobacter pauli]